MEIGEIAREIICQVGGAQLPPFLLAPLDEFVRRGPACLEIGAPAGKFPVKHGFQIVAGRGVAAFARFGIQPGSLSLVPGFDSLKLTGYEGRQVGISAGRRR
jgi:hypothetical protein